MRYLGIWPRVNWTRWCYRSAMDQSRFWKEVTLFLIEWYSERERYRIKLFPDKRLIGITVFQIALARLLHKEYQEWTAFFGSIETLMNKKLVKREGAILSITFQPILEDLRTAEYWINSTTRDLGSLHDDMCASIRISSSVLEDNWKALIECQEKISESLIRQMQTIKDRTYTNPDTSQRRSEAIVLEVPRDLMFCIAFLIRW
ncbi:hypothetical protein BKA66DRAFT_448340 [Pyrenochaeta sp. MPI-SDFR-AT-0127]|nr:hypothetical protein BKA66DRAFT_448340 [Pyrenochaeta sp. MPI-SDFR-AT-0127]